MFCVIKFHISINASHELALGVILGPINFLSLHGGKEGLGHSIVMGTAGLRERLDNLVHAKQFPGCAECRKINKERLYQQRNLLLISSKSRLLFISGL